MRARLTYHKVESGHEQDEIDEQQPVPLEGDLALLKESRGDAATDLGTDGLALSESLGLGETQAEDDDEDGRASSEPVEGSPAVRGGVDEAAGERCCQQVSEGVALLQETGHDTARLHGTVLESGGRCITIQSAHGDSEESTAGTMAISDVRFDARKRLTGIVCMSGRNRFRAPER